MYDAAFRIVTKVSGFMAIISFSSRAVMALKDISTSNTFTWAQYMQMEMEPGSGTSAFIPVWHSAFFLQLGQTLKVSVIIGYYFCWVKDFIHGIPLPFHITDMKLHFFLADCLF